MLATALAVYLGRAGSPFAVSALSTALFFSVMVFTPLWGALGDLTGRRRTLLVVASGGATVAAAGFLVVDGVWPTVALRGVYAAFAVGVSPLLLTIAGALAGEEHRGRAAGAYSSAMAAGDVGAQLLVGLLVASVAPPAVFGVVAGLSLAATLIVTRIDDPFARPGESVAVGDGGGPEDRAASRTLTDRGGAVRTLVRGVRERLVPAPSERAALREAGLTWLFGGLVLRHACVRGVSALVPLFLLVELGVSEVVMGLLLTVSPLGQVAFMPLFGRMADEGPRRRVLLVGFLASAVYPVLLALSTLPDGSTSVGLAVLGFLAVAVGFSGLDIGVITVLGGVVPPERESAFLGLRATAGGLGGVVGPTLVGAGVVLLGYRPAFLLAGAGATVATLVVARTLPEPRGPPAAGGIVRVESSLGSPLPTGRSRLRDDDTIADD
jgi:MFS family permease